VVTASFQRAGAVVGQAPARAQNVGEAMPRHCTICDHEQREVIDQALVAGESFRGLSAKYRVSEDALARHKERHLPVTLAQAHQAQEVARADDLLGQIKELRDKAYGILSRAEADGDLRTALAAIREARGCLELLAKLLGELSEQPVVNILLLPEWVQLRTRLLYALTSYPEARQAVAKTLLEVGGGTGD